MKISVSLPDEDVIALDRYAARVGLTSRSSAVHHAIQLLDRPDLGQAYEQAWDEWEASGDAADWEGTAADGLTDASR